MNDITSSHSSNKRHRTLVLLLVLIFSSLTYLLWQQTTRSHQELQEQIDILNNQVTDLKAELQALLTEDEQENLEDALETRLQPLRKQQQRLETHLIELGQQFQKSTLDENWRFAKIASLLSIAHDRMVLAQDFDGALKTLQLAKQELKGFNHPALLQVKSQLDQHIQVLNRLSQVHVTQVATSLVHHVTRAEHFPLLQNVPQADSPDPLIKEEMVQIDIWQDLAPMIWKQLKTLVTVRYNPQAQLGLFTPEQTYFIRQSLKLKLEIAHFCLLHREAEKFKIFLQAASKWLTQYYDIQNQDVQALQKDLATMQNLEFTPSLPNLYETLTLFQQQFVSEKISP